MKIKLIISVILLGCGLIFAQTEETNLGTEITLTEKTKISDILADPDSYLDQTVLVEGEILDVCPKMGCWMELKSDDGEAMIKVKVKDGDIVFPVDAIGDYAVVQGTVYKIELTQEEAVNYFEHLAEESGENFDPSIITGPMTIYQIKGLGAEINQKEG
jgi:predicted RNA-binding protein